MGALTGREQLVKAVEQLAQAEFDHEDLAALVSRPHAHMRVGGAGDLDVGCSAERLEPGHLVLAGRRHDVHSAQYLVTAVIGVKGTNVTY